ncbi:hypothetical protein ACFSL6_01435 [Paenibacillus thailandensis]|uniref:Uncharacterized protein n=1 Tax=Paenibacillus thailandensis TaxID=393250 RepID=A0ABW5R435_9BACL
MNPTRYDLKNNADFFYAIFCEKHVYYISENKIGCGQIDLFTDAYVIIDGESFNREASIFYVDN